MRLGLGAVLGAGSYFSSPISMVQTKSLQVPTVGQGSAMLSLHGTDVFATGVQRGPSCETKTFHTVSFRFLVALTYHSYVVQDYKKTKPNCKSWPESY